MINKNNIVYKKNYLREHQIKSIFIILKLIQNKKNLDILDVGCANGNLVSFLKKKLNYQHNFEAVELDKNIVKNKKIFDRIYFTDFEKFLKKNSRNLWRSYTVGTGKQKIILNNLDMINNYYHVLIKKC